MGKQRIAAELGTAAALELSELLLATTLEDAREWQGPVVIAPADSADAGWAATLLPDAHVVPQLGANLGDRINHVDRQLRAAGARRIIYVGIDAPGHTAQTLADAQQALDHYDVVLLPARDGGVTLMGSRQPWPELAELPWETAQLCIRLRQTCEQAGEQMALLAEGYDIDRFADLLTALPALREDKRPARHALAAWTEDQLSISIIIPVKQDTDALAELLEQLQVDLRGSDEILVVSAEQSQASAEICSQYGARLLHHQGSRGARMNRGAGAARNRILWFLHADAEPVAAAPQIVRNTIGGGAAGGYFRFRFRGAAKLVKRALEACINFRTRFGIPYADQGLFMTRLAFDDAGGFADQSLFEEVALVKALRAHGQFIRLPASLGVSPRRWERDGWWRRTLHNRLLVLGYRLGVPNNTLAKIYRQADPAADQRSR